MNQENIIEYIPKEPVQGWLFPPTPANGSRIIQLDLPKWIQRIKARAGSERVTILDGRPVQFECQFRTRIPLEITL
jgi:hypothetical protein